MRQTLIHSIGPSQPWIKSARTPTGRNPACCQILVNTLHMGRTSPNSDPNLDHLRDWQLEYVGRMFHHCSILLLAIGLDHTLCELLCTTRHMTSQRLYQNSLLDTEKFTFDLKASGRRKQFLSGAAKADNHTRDWAGPFNWDGSIQAGSRTHRTRMTMPNSTIWHLWMPMKRV